MHFLPPEARRYMADFGMFGPSSALATHGFESQGLMPEHFPPAYDDFILDVITSHPQMTEMRRKLLGDRFVIDHCVMLNWSPGSRGRAWHGHHYREGQYEVEDQIGSGNAVTSEFAQQQCVRTLCYPEGATIEDGGELAVIPGAHLYRIPYKSKIERTDDDVAIQADWLPGKVHPITGRPLEIRHLSLPPGSMVSFVHHMPHYAGPRRPTASTRWALLMAYRTPDSMASPAQWTSGIGVPAQWIERIVASGLISPSALRVFEADNPLN